MSDEPQFFTTEHPFDTDKDISSDAFWALPFRERDRTFEWLRKNAPVSWHPPMDAHGWPNNEKGFWAITKAADIRFVSENHELFSSAISKTLNVRPGPPFQPSMILSDPPEHERFRQMVSASFTPKAVKQLIEKIDRRAAQIVDKVVGAGEIDFVAHVSSQLPMLTIADLIGIPEELVERFTEAGDNFAAASDPQVRPAGMGPGEFIGQQIAILSEIGLEVVKYRRRHPADDLATALGRNRVDGRPLTDEEIGAVTLLLSAAGNDTTKQTTSWSVHQLWNDPAQREWLADDYDARILPAIEEFVRHTSPVTTFSRVATEDVELGGRTIAKHDKVVLYYPSGNRDEDVYEEPWRFDLDRPRRPHVGFGGGGIHYCLGNAVAKAQLRALFREFTTKLTSMDVGEPEFLATENFNYIRRLPVRI